MSSIINNIELTGKNIVIVEDDPSLSKYYKALLRNTGADVRIFHTGKEFVDYYDQNFIHLVSCLSFSLLFSGKLYDKGNLPVH